MFDRSKLSRSGIYISFTQSQQSTLDNDRMLFKCIKSPDGEYDIMPFKHFLERIFINMYREDRTDTKTPKSRKGSSVRHNIKLGGEVLDIMEKLFAKESDAAAGKRISSCFNKTIDRYCALSLSDRERIFFRDMILDARDAHDLHRIIRIEKTNGSRPILLLPDRITVSDETGHLYLVGHRLRYPKRGRTQYLGPSCTPVYRIFPCGEGTRSFKTIADIDPKRDIDFKVYNKGNSKQLFSFQMAEDELGTALENGGLLYLGAPTYTVRVTLTEAGLDIFSSRLQYRPKEFELKTRRVTVKGRSYRIGHLKFEGTWLQTFMYFFKFGQDAVITEPLEFKEKFEKKYAEAFKAYSLFKHKEPPNRSRSANEESRK